MSESYQQLFLRHGTKQYSNGKSLKLPFDPALTEQGVKDAYVWFKYIVSMYETPKLIFCSPFLRTRETALILHEVIKELKGVDLPIVIDRRIGEFINMKHKDVDFTTSLTKDTLSYDPFLLETTTQLKKRINEFTKEKGKTNMWVISHGYTIIHVAKLHNLSINRPIPLHGIINTDDRVEII